MPSSPLALGYTPLAMAVTRDNKFLYVAALGNINVYTINSDGSLTAASGGTGVAIANVVSMDVSPDGQWLLALDGTTLRGADRCISDQLVDGSVGVCVHRHRLRFRMRRSFRRC